MIAANGDYTFTPAADWNGDVPQVTYTTDTGSSTTLDITVTPVSDPAVIGGTDIGAVTEDASSPTLTDTGSLTEFIATFGDAASSTFDLDDQRITTVTCVAP